ncbi:hypothetical protein ATO2_17585 [Roseovarius sp. 22II1-1F6A]|nr:hypothetical protein ATO2_17585 [Roseovarius sp. 22II1-1F6A]
MLHMRHYDLEHRIDHVADEQIMLRMTVRGHNVQMPGSRGWVRTIKEIRGISVPGLHSGF